VIRKTTIVPRIKFTHDCSDWDVKYGVDPPGSAPTFHPGSKYEVPSELADLFYAAGWCESEESGTGKRHCKITVKNSILGAKDSHGEGRT